MKMTEQKYIEKVKQIISRLTEDAGRNLSPAELAAASGLPAEHLHLIFRAFTGKSLADANKKIRLCRAACLLAEKPSLKISDAAAETGFGGINDFRTAFSEKFGCSPTAWKKNNGGKRPAASFKTSFKDIGGPTAESAEVRELPDLDLACVRHGKTAAGDYSLIIYLYSKLAKWAEANGHKGAENRNVVIYKAPADIYGESRSSIILGITVSDSSGIKGDIKKRKIAGGRHLVCRYRLREDQYDSAWRQVYGYWLPKLDLKPAAGGRFEYYPAVSSETGRFISTVDLCIPVADG